MVRGFESSGPETVDLSIHGQLYEEERSIYKDLLVEINICGQYLGRLSNNSLLESHGEGL